MIFIGSDMKIKTKKSQVPFSINKVEENNSDNVNSEITIYTQLL